MGINSGNQAKLQVGAQSNFSTAVAPTVAIPFTSENLKYVPNYLESDALVGNRMTNRMDVSAIHVEGDFSMIVDPDSIGLLLAAVMGAEASPAAVDSSAVYDHVFTPISAVVGSSLPELTIVVDRNVAAFGYIGCKIDKMTLSAKSKDYLRATFSVRGYDEQSDTAESLSVSTKRPFQFVDGNITVDGSEYDEVINVDMDFINNLETDLFTMNGSNKQIEFEPQQRECTLRLETLYSSTTNTTRTNKFKAGDTAAIVLTFTSSEEVLTGKYYTLTLTLPLCYITDAAPAVGGPERIKQTLEVKASESSSQPGITITLRDGQSTKFIT